MHFKAEQVFLPLKKKKNTSILIISTNQGLFKYTQTTGGRTVNQKEKEYFKTFDKKQANGSHLHIPLQTAY